MSTPTDPAAALAEAVRAFLKWIPHNAKLGTNGLVQALAAYDATKAEPEKAEEWRGAVGFAGYEKDTETMVRH